MSNDEIKIIGHLCEMIRTVDALDEDYLRGYIAAIRQTWEFIDPTLGRVVPIERFDELLELV